MYKIFMTLLHLMVVPCLFSETLELSAQPATSVQPAIKNIQYVTGIVEDAKQHTISYATVFIFTPDAPGKVYKAMACDNDGRFKMPLSKGKYIIKVTSVGYKDKSLNFELDSLPVHLGTITLQENITELQEITVRPLVEQNAREIVYNITSDPSRESSSMLDIFDKVPFLSIIDDKVVAGNDPTKSIIVLRNGCADALFSGGTSISEVLRKLPAMGFTNIKILLDKPDKYKGYDYVITVTADKTQRLFGAVGQSSASYRLDRNLDLAQNVVASADKTRMSGTIRYNWDKPLRKESGFTMSGTDFSQVNNERTEMTKDTYEGSMIMSHDITEKQFLSGRFSTAINEGNTHNFGTTEFLTDNLPPTYTKNNTYNDRLNKSFEGSLAYHNDIKPDNKIFSASYTLKTLPSHNTQKQFIENTIMGSLNSTLRKTQEHEYSHYLSLDYMDKLTSKLSLTGRTSLLLANNDRETRKYDTTTPGHQYEYTNNYDYFERPVHRLDGMLSLSWLATSNLNILAYIRPDYILNSSKIKMISGGDAPVFYKERNWTLDYNVNMRIILDKKKKASGDANSRAGGMPSMPNVLNIRYGVTQNRPAYTALSSYVDDSNPDYLVTGNPFLKNETLHTIGTGFNGWILNPSLSFSFSNDKIASYWYQNQDDKLVRSFTNWGLYNKVDLRLNKMFLLSNDFTKCIT